MQELIVNINDDGVISYIKDPKAPAFEGSHSQRRASNVLPHNPIKRIAFKALRLVFGNRGRVSDWTRTWTGENIVNIVGGPTLGPFGSRREALDYEVQYLLDTQF